MLRVETRQTRWSDGVKGVAVSAEVDGRSLDVCHLPFVQPPTRNHMVMEGRDAAAFDRLFRALTGTEQDRIRARIVAALAEAGTW